MSETLVRVSDVFVLAVKGSLAPCGLLPAVKVRIRLALRTVVFCALSASLVAPLWSASRMRAAETKDPLAAEIARWSAFLSENTSTDSEWTQVKAVSQPVIEAAAAALRDGRRLWALQRLAAVRFYLSGSQYVQSRTPEALKDPAAFEAEWARMGGVLRADLGKPSPSALDGVRPAALRAIGEASIPQIKGYYDAGLEYGRDTMAKSGYLYIGAAQGQRELVSLCRTLSSGSASKTVPIRSIAPELDALESTLLSAYRPPASIDKHGEFIGASSTLNEARALDAAGLRYGALLRYLQAVLRTKLIFPPQPIDVSALKDRLREFDARLSAGNVDHSIGRIFLEAAQADLENPAAEASRFQRL